MKNIKIKIHKIICQLGISPHCRSRKVFRICYHPPPPAGTPMEIIGLPRGGRGRQIPHIKNSVHWGVGVSLFPPKATHERKPLLLGRCMRGGERYEREGRVVGRKVFC